MSRIAFLSACALSLAGCRQLPEIPADICGNGVIESAEDCDGISRGGLRCRPPGAVGQCRLDCTPQLDGTRTPCPAGSGCDEQNVCRRATGEYRPVASGIPGSTRSLSSGDFDGDGRADVVGLETPGAYGGSKTRIHYFDASGEPRATWSVAAELGQPTVTSLFADPRADLAYSTGALGILSGEPDGSLIHETYPSYYLSSAGVRVFPVLEARIDEGVAFVILAAPDGKYGLFRTDSAAASLTRFADLPGGTEALAAEPIVSDLRNDDARYPCLDVAFAYRGARELLLVAACERDPTTGRVRWRDTAEITRIPLEAPSTIDRGLLVADFDGDGHRDLMVGTMSGPHAAFGNGANFLPARPFPIRFSPPEASFVTMPIAAGQFVGDAAADLVLPDRLVIAVPGPGENERSYSTYYGNLGSPWSAALVADFNGNGKPDLVATSATGIDLDFFNGTGETLVASTVPTTSSVRHLAAGDFDGDLIQDVAFVQKGSRSAGEDELSIAFGSVAGAPSAPVTTARLAGIEQIAPFFADPGWLSSLTIINDQPSAGGDSTSALSLLIGNGNRSLPCPIELSTFADDGSIENANSMALTVGSFTDRSRRDLLALGYYGDFLGDDFGLWLLPDVASRRSPPRSLGRRLDLPIRPILSVNAVPELAIRMAAGDLDNSGLDDLVLVAPDASGVRCIAVSATVPGASALMLREPITFDDQCVRGTELALADLDSDTFLDVVLLLGGSSVRTKLMVLWGDGSGTLRADQLSLVAQGSDAPAGFTLFRSTPGAPLWLAYVTERGVRLVSTDGTRRFEEVRLPIELEQGTGITAADVNGDGVVDLVVADFGTVRVLRAELVD